MPTVWTTHGVFLAKGIPLGYKASTDPETEDLQDVCPLLAANPRLITRKALSPSFLDLVIHRACSGVNHFETLN